MAAASAEELNLFQELFTYQNLVHAISGATGGIVAIRLVGSCICLFTCLPDAVDPLLRVDKCS